MKVKQKSERKSDNVLRGPKVAKKMKPPAVAKTSLAKQASGELPKMPVNPKKVQISKKKPAASFLASPASNITTKNKGKSEELTLKNSGFDVSSKMIEQALQALLQLHDEFRKKSKTLLFNDKEFVYIQLAMMKIPKVPEQRRKYVKLHHGIFGEEPEVCLFVNDRKANDHVKRTQDEKIEYSVEYYQELLKAHQIEGITTVMPLYQLRTEYDSYELRRKLVDKFDIFLCQATLLDNGTFLKKLGISFNKKNKLPLTLKFPKDPTKLDVKFRERVSTLLRTSWYTLKPHGDTVSVRAGTVSHSLEQLRENVVHVLHQLTSGEDAIPGGVPNVRSVMLKTSRSKAVPLYVNLAAPSSVPVPIVKSIRPVITAEEDELSTMPGKKVSVLPSGEVFVSDDPNQKLLPGWNSDEDSEDEKEDDGEVPLEKESSSDEEEKLPKKKTRKQKNQTKKTKTKEESEGVVSEDSDVEAEAAEQQYLASWEKKTDEDDDNDDEGEEEKVAEKKVKGKKNSGKAKGKAVPSPKKLTEGKRKNQESNKAAKRLKASKK